MASSESASRQLGRLRSVPTREVWRPSTATWYLKYSTRIQDQPLQWGAAGDVPVSGDFDGDTRPTTQSGAPPPQPGQ